MAKLSARGRTCVVEITREYDAATIQAHHDQKYHDGQSAGMVWARSTRRLMTDGTVLQKRDSKMAPSKYDPAGQRHSTGWTVRGKLKAGKTAADFARAYRAPRPDGTPSRWTVTEYGAGTRAPKTIVISQDRILKACEADDYTGFCLACGNEQEGCEPDARGYTCESCGQPDVYGAQELLLGVTI
jgi:hypothetical protein